MLKREIIIPGSIIKNLEAIALSVFPLEIDACLPIKEIDDKDVAVEIHLNYDEIDPRAFIYSQNFEMLIRCLKNNGIDNLELDIMKKNHKKAEELFKVYKKCQKKRKENLCHVINVQSSDCDGCVAYGQPRLPDLYGWFPNSPSVAWHSHVTSKYGDIEKLSNPSAADSYALSRLINLKGLPIIAEMITCTSEKGQQITKLYENPEEGIFVKQQTQRKQITLSS